MSWPTLCVFVTHLKAVVTGWGDRSENVTCKSICLRISLLSILFSGLLPWSSVSAQTPVPFACTGDAFLAKDIDTQLILVDQSVSPFVFIPIGGPAGIEYNNLGFRRTDGLLYAIELTSGNTDTDGDGVPDPADACPDTVIPETVPLLSLGRNRWALVDGDNIFDTNRGNPKQTFTLEDTAGCSCEQIIDARHLGKGHREFGCSKGALESWIELVSADDIPTPPSATDGNVQVIQIDSNGSVFGLGRPAGLPENARFDAGDISTDGSTMYLTANGQPLYQLSLPSLSPVISTTITGDSGDVHDWAYNPTDGRLYGGDSSGGELAMLDPATGVRTDVAVSGLPSGIPFGGAWFNAAGRLFLFQDNGNVFEIDLAGPTIASTQTGPESAATDAAACVQDVIGAAKQMITTTDGLPETITIDYVFENLSPVEDLFSLSAIDDLSAVFGVYGVDWTFTSISSVPASFANPTFNGHTDTELVNQAPTQSLPPGATATLNVVIELLTSDNQNPDGTFCNQVLTAGETASGVVFGDVSTDGSDPDPNGDGSPDERRLACVSLSPLLLVKTGIFNDESGDGFAQPGETISFSFEVTNTGNVTLVNIAITDPRVAPITCPSGNPIPSLASGATETCTGTYTLIQADVEAGQVVNTATASGTDPGGNPVSYSDMEIVLLPSQP